MKHRRQPQKILSMLGFSLLELMVVVFLIAAFVSISVPLISSLTALDLKKEITRVAALSSEAFFAAAISGKTYRVVFDLDTQTYWAEEKEGEAGEIMPELGYDDLMKMRQEKNISSKEKEGALRHIPRFKEAPNELGVKYTLPKDIVIHGVWNDSLDDVSRTGQVAIYFFSGYAQSSFVSLAIKGEEENSVMYSSLGPLTGEIEIENGEPDLNQMRATESEI